MTRKISVTKELAPTTQHARAALIIRAFDGCERDLVVKALALMEQATGKGGAPAGWLTPSNMTTLVQGRIV